MTQQNSIHLQIISIIILIFLQSCSIGKNPTSETFKTNIVIKDYISEFSTINYNKPKAILIREGENSIITIKDLPLKASMGYLLKSIEKKEDLSAGMVANVLCIYYNNEIDKKDIMLKDVPLKLQKRAKVIDKIVIDGKELIISNDMVEWQPLLEIKYDVESNKKVINNFISRTERKTDFMR